MKNNLFTNSRPMKRWRLFFLLAFFPGAVMMPACAYAHQTPSTIVLLDVSPGRVAMELQLPLSELELAFGNGITKDPETLLERMGPQLAEYLKAHIHPYVSKERPWIVEIAELKMDKGVQAASGPPYWELLAHLIARPQPGENTRKFKLDYDVIMHQVINHAAFVSIRNDWETGSAGKDPAEAGVIRWDMKDNVIYPLEINLEKGSWWKGFKGMISLGIAHIKEGTDHLLFLLVLLLPSMLLPFGKQWGKFGGARYSIVRLLKIVTAFTVGHSITLLIGALGWIKLPAQPVEILIAFSILVSAIHAVRPLFPGKEARIAAGFGLVHGLAFATVLSNLHLGAGAMVLSILGFNLGIELMQLFIILLIVPWLILLSRTPAYKWIRRVGAGLAAIAAVAWIVERSSGSPNIIAGLVQKGAQYAWWCILLLAVSALLSWRWEKKKPVSSPRPV